MSYLYSAKSYESGLMLSKKLRAIFLPACRNILVSVPLCVSCNGAQITLVGFSSRKGGYFF
jgi:hypothetical protein